jgi:hypothetical protein
VQKNVLRSSSNLSASNLKEALWSTLNSLKSKKITPGHGDAIASQAREILRTVRTQLLVSGQTGRSVPFEVIEFSEGKLRKGPKK